MKTIVAVLRRSVLCAASIGMCIAPAFAAESDFKGKIGMTARDSVPAWPERPKAPAGAPNVLIWVIDDAGFAHLHSYGGLIDTPTTDGLAQQGLRFSTSTPLRCARRRVHRCLRAAIRMQ